MITQVYHRGYSTTLMNIIADYKKYDAVAISKVDKYVITRRGPCQIRKSTVGWKLLVQWKDGSETWIPLKYMNNSHLFETAEFACVRGIDDEVAFRYWVMYILRKRDIIIALIKTRFRKVTHKFGIDIPTSIKHYLEIDRINQNTLWRDALELEIMNSGIAFDILGDNDIVPPGWYKIMGHVIFD